MNPDQVQDIENRLQALTESYHNHTHRGYDGTPTLSTTTVVATTPHSAVFAKGFASAPDLHTANNNLGIDGDTCTIAFWFKPISNPTAAQTWAILELTSGTTRQVAFRFEYIENAGNYDLVFNRDRVGTAITAITKSSANLGTTTWHHIVGTYDTTNIKLYLDGALVAGPTAASGNGGGAYSSAIIIANSQGNFTKNDAKFDDVRVYSTDLGATAIAALYSSPSTVIGTEAGLVAGYPFDDSLLTDVSAHAYTLSMSSTVSQATDNPID